jgi:hypothetical protein
MRFGAAAALISVLSTSASAWVVETGFEGQGASNCAVAHIPHGQTVHVSELEPKEVVAFYVDEFCSVLSDFIDTETTQPLPEDVSSFNIIVREE